MNAKAKAFVGGLESLTIGTIGTFGTTEMDRINGDAFPR